MKFKEYIFIIMNNNYVTPETARRHYNVSNNTLRKWDREGKIETIRIGTHRRYRIKHDSTIEHISKQQRNVIYARVSSFDQKKDLEKQIDILQRKFPGYEVIKDIGSGLNFKRKGLTSLVKSIINGDIKNIVVTDKDRLCRFGFELIETILQSKGGSILVFYQSDKSPNQELVDDVISIITVFSSKMYGRRSHRNKREI